MSKAILVMDMPECCRKCDLRVIGAYNFCTGTGGRKIDQMTIINEDIKPDWCPLRPMPEKKEELNLNSILEVTKDKDEVWQGIFMSYMIDGYNACIDEIGGNNETDKETHQST